MLLLLLLLMLLLFLVPGRRVYHRAWPIMAGWRDGLRLTLRVARFVLLHTALVGARNPNNAVLVHPRGALGGGRGGEERRGMPLLVLLVLLLLLQLTLII